MSQLRDIYASSSPPRTPPSQTAKYRSKRGYPGQAPLRDAFPDAASIENAPTASELGDDRDPHDLSLSPQHAARTSIVDNMLLSLDQFAAPEASVLDDYRLYNSAFGSEMHGRYRSHASSFSTSSEPDYDYDVNNNSSRFATIATRSRQSTSSSSYQTLTRRLDSARGDTMGSRGSGRKPRSSDSWQGSKGSSSADFGYNVPRTRADSDGMGRRSPSFDCGPRKYVPYADHRGQESLLEDDDGDEAAPTPGIPSGPHKIPENSTIPSAYTSRTLAASRRNSLKSAQGHQIRKARADNLGTGILRSRDNDFQLSGDTDLDPPTLIPSSSELPAPSPTISYNKPAFPSPDPAAKITSTTITTTNSVSAMGLKEKPSFFRRVFGSGRNSTPVLLDSPNSNVTGIVNVNDLAYLQDNEAKDPTGATVNLKERDSVVFKTPTGPPTPSSATRKGPPQVINKKPSFFRRRKKSVTDSGIPPPIVLPQDLAPQAFDSLKPQPSPVSSLRKVMNDYLADDVQTSQGSKRLREPTLLDKPRDFIPLGGNSATNKALQPPSSFRQDRSPLADSRGGDDRPVRGEDVGFASADAPLQGKRSSAAPSIAPKPSDKPSRGIQSSSMSITQEAPDSSVKEESQPQIPESPSTSEASRYQTAANTPIIDDMAKPFDETTESPMDGPGDAIEDGPTASDREQALKLYESQDQVVGNEPAAAWLGGPDRAMIREAYMRLYNWSNMNILAALRSLCVRLVLKGESQQVDRVLDAFSTRWCDSNPSHGFKATDVVHTICYSLLLLNTDLHLADIDQKMTKSQFVRNTMPTIHRVAMDAAPDGFETLRPNNRSKTASLLFEPSQAPNITRSSIDPARRNSLEMDNSDRNTADSDAGPLVNTPFIGNVRVWEQQVEAILKDFYTSIQKERLPLHGAQPEREVTRMTSTTSFLTPSTGILRRSPSTISKSGSDIYPRGRSADSRHGAARWSSKPRSRGGNTRLYPASMMGSSRTSLDDQSSVLSPTASSTWSKYSLGKFTSASVDSFGSDYPRGDYQQSIGFANALSQAIIREDSAPSIYSFDEPERTTPLLEDETLALAGAPWAKEGSVKHKHHLDAVDKRAKDRNWNECFAVIQQGWMRLFSFSNTTKTMRQKAKQRGGVVVGGGNWTENAEEIWKFMLRQTIASALPPPGYSKSRPHVWALSLPTGAVHLFQAGTPEIVREFVSTANYWSARLSKEPLVGGISNIEYGWSDAVINSALGSNESRSPPPSGPHHHSRPSIQSSIRSSLDQQGVRSKLPADRVNISDWSPPQQSMVASHLTEEDQLKALQAYVKNVEDDLQRHNELRGAMNLAFTLRHPNANKAMANWERKSSYLLREIVKFRTYIDSLRNAISQKEKIYASSNNYHLTPDEINNPESEPLTVST
ncbi:hypothetical protein N7495_009802 [Penicillium taxi]|uniref:uncharacterized protein n=1 Tax=Penicillium taxi TaxID=168475 RepID=UPI0025451690|nr:uncharacterized protein N7495_009802 [Penicillium taxi]KAJ5885292.1 hypothetical protein N7495_009802 [Penicillium taxi]